MISTEERVEANEAARRLRRLLREQHDDLWDYVADHERADGRSDSCDCDACALWLDFYQLIKALDAKQEAA